jgi:hypothetical protein
MVLVPGTIEQPAQALKGIGGESEHNAHSQGINRGSLRRCPLRYEFTTSQQVIAYYADSRKKGWWSYLLIFGHGLTGIPLSRIEQPLFFWQQVAFEPGRLLVNTDTWREIPNAVAPSRYPS